MGAFPGWIRSSLVSISVAAICILFPVTLWFVSFGFAAGYLCLFLLVSGCVAGWKRKSAKTILLLPVAWLALNGVLAADSVGTYDQKRARYFGKIRRNEDLGFVARLNVYGLNIAMSLLAWPIYREASLESICLLVPSRGGTRSFRGGFFLESEKIREALSEGPLHGTRRIRWSEADYVFGRPEARFALALNPCELSEDPLDSTLRVKVRVEYPMSSEVKLLRSPIEITVEEGLFGYLQKTGWLHPYDAIWSSGSRQGALP